MKVTFKYDSSLVLRDFLKSANVFRYQVNLERKLLTCKSSEEVLAAARKFKLKIVKDAAAASTFFISDEV
ncbi:MAG TPA: hypothetical protein VL098_08485 [Flavipsychrobacter sp.]|nr:hypothetical protein [Flavipsychrobacter sp.]